MDDPTRLRRVELSFTAILAILAAQAAPASETMRASEDRQWQFRVYLDDKEVGYHHYRVQGDERQRQVGVDASFDVKILFFNAFSYRHTTQELWFGDCLQDIDSSTRAGKKSYAVKGTAETTGFQVATQADTTSIPKDCVRSFAYWDKRLLDMPSLLNAQTGQLVDVQAQPPRQEEIQVMGETILAERHDLKLEKGVISLWYDPAGVWVGLQAPAPGGRILDYRPEKLPMTGFGGGDRVASR